MSNPSLPPLLSGHRPLVGHLLEFNGSAERLMHRGRDEHGDAISLRIPGYRHVIALLSEASTETYWRHSGLSTESAYPFLKPFFGDFFVAADDATYKKHKSVLQPQFSGRVVAGHIHMMDEEAALLASALGDRGSMVLTEILGPTILKIAARAFLGDRFTQEMGDGFFNEFRTFSRGMVFTPAWLPTPASVRSRRAARRLKARISAMIATRREAPLDEPDFLQRLSTQTYDDGTSIDDETIVAMALTLIWAGHETTVGHLAWAISDLLQHPEVLADVVAEADAAYASGPLDMTAVRALTKVRASVRESGRLHPIAPIVARVATTDIPLDRWTIPVGALVLASPAVLHRSPDRFPRPDTYLPERFLVEGGHTALAGLVDFGRDKHRCLGANFAETEMAILLVHLLADFELTLLSGPPEPVRHGGAQWPDRPLVSYSRRSPATTRHAAA